MAVRRNGSGTLVSSAALEIVVDPGNVFDAGTKYDGSAQFLVPAPLSTDVRESLMDTAHLLYDGLGCSGVARFDFFASEAGIVLNEVNTSPGLSDRSQVPLMFAASGTSYPDLLDALVHDAVTAHHGIIAG